MGTLFKALALKLVVGRTVGGVLAALFVVLLPIVGVLKVIGLPLLMVLGVVGAPLMALLALVGLPVLLVVGIGGFLLLAFGALLSLGIIAVKIVLPIVLIVWFIRWLRRPPPIVTGPDAA